MRIERQYWKKVQDNYHLKDYPDVDEEAIQFPVWMSISYAVCGKECGNRQWIVDGGPQICDWCGNSMFRTATRWYKIMPPDEKPTEEERSELFTVWRPDTVNQEPVGEGKQA